MIQHTSKLHQIIHRTRTDDFNCITEAQSTDQCEECIRTAGTLSDVFFSLRLNKQHMLAERYLHQIRWSLWSCFQST